MDCKAELSNSVSKKRYRKGTFFLIEGQDALVIAAQSLVVPSAANLRLLSGFAVQVAEPYPIQYLKTPATRAGVFK